MEIAVFDNQFIKFVKDVKKEFDRIELLNL